MNDETANWQACGAASSLAMFGRSAGQCHLTAGHDGMHDTGLGARWLATATAPEPVETRLAAAIARAEKAEAQLAFRAETDAAAAPLHDYVQKLRAAGDRQASEFQESLITENCDLRTRAEEAEAERDQLRAQLAAGDTEQAEYAQRIGTLDAGSYWISVDNDIDSYWVRVRHRPCGTDIFGDIDSTDPEDLNADRLLSLMAAHRCDAVPRATEATETAPQSAQDSQGHRTHVRAAAGPT